MKPDIAIVAIGYNRPHALKRLLESLKRADYDRKVPLYISIDGGGQPDSGPVAAEFHWQGGPKQVIRHDTHLGLREHVIQCGDLSAQHDALIVLEDDLAVSPQFYAYALQAYAFYKDDDKIAGISLYNHAYNETAQFPFVPLSDGSDVYFMQYASSLGQMWTAHQWSQFRHFFDRGQSGSRASTSFLPPNVRLWPKTSWKKHFVEYMVARDLFFVFPRVSLSTVFGDEGTHIRTRETFLQVPLRYGSRPWIFSSLNDSCCVYDGCCEILPDRLKRLWREMEREDFDVDLYGMKATVNIRSPKLMSSRFCRAPHKLYGRERKPHEENLIHQVPGRNFCYGSKEDFRDVPYMARLLKCHEKKELAYWYPIREYHFCHDVLLSTSKESLSLSDHAFWIRKFLTTLRFVFRYYCHRG